MLKSALNYISSELGVGGDAAAEDVSPTSAVSSAEDAIVGSRVDVGGVGVRVKRRIGEGGFAFVYSVVGDENAGNHAGKGMALKRLLAVDQEKKDQIVQEIAFLKSLKPCPYIMQFVTAANLDRGLSATKCEEFLLLTELCVTNLYECLSSRTGPYPPVTVGRIFFQVLEAVNFMHRSTPPIAHRDLKVENLLVDKEGRLKLCDFGSATTKTHEPDETWNMQRRTQMGEEIERHTTPMYRAPEMLDVWSNHRVGVAADVWALGCLLYQLSFHSHPFEDGAKLRIINANYTIPTWDKSHVMFHDLIRQCLAIDPSLRPTAQQALEHLGQVAVLSEWDLELPIDFELTSTPSDDPLLTVEVTETEEGAYQPQLPPVPTSRSQRQPNASSTAYGLFSTFKGAGSSMLGKVRDSTRVLVGSLITAGRDLDFSVVTSKLVAMSFPAEGIDLTHKNQLDDVRQILENHHADHYAVVNLCERKYHAARFARGKVIDANWTSTLTPTVEQLLTMTMRVLEYLGQNKHNVVAVHCLDGRSNTAMLVTSILLATKVFSRHRDALALFEHKRCEPVLSFGQRNVLKQLEKAIRSGPQIHLCKQAVTLNSVILEPVPLFTKAGDGVRPFVEVYCDGKLVASSFKDYTSLTLFTPYDGEAILKTNIKVPPGDITVMVFHARQSFAGGLLSSSGASGIKICQVYFNPSTIPDSRSYVRFPTHEIDGLTTPLLEKIPADFSVSVNFARKDSPRSFKFPYLLPEKRRPELIFSGKTEFSEVMGSLGHKENRRQDEDIQEEEAPKRPPRSHKHQPGSDMPKPSSLVDIAGLSETQRSGLEAPIDRLKQQQKPTSLVDLDDLASKQNRDNEILLDLTGEASGKRQEARLEDLLGGFGSTNEEKVTPRVPQPSANPGDPVISDLLGGLSSPSPSSSSSGGAAAWSSSSAAPRVPMPAPAGGTQEGDLLGDLLGGGDGGAANSAGNGAVSGGISNGHINKMDPFGCGSTTTSSDDFGGLLAPQAPPTVKSSDKLVEDMLSNLDLESHKTAASNNKASHQKKAQQQQHQWPNYNSAFFQTNPEAATKPASKATFEDLLGGFTPTSDQSNRTIGEMKKEETKKAMTPNEAKIFEWKDGKSRNLRALLCSLHTVVWPDCNRWPAPCQMHQLVTFDDVKKMYRRACLAVHPDKQLGTENEELSKMIFTELNDAWSKFQEDEGK